MIKCTIHNPTKAPRILFDASARQVSIAPGASVVRELDRGTYSRLLNLRNDLRVIAFPQPPDAAEQPKIVPPLPEKQKLHIVGHFGIGDNLHQRGPLRELLKTYDVSLETCMVFTYHDLIEQGLRLVFRSTGLHAQHKIIARERGTYEWHQRPVSTHGTRRFYYNRPEVEKFGSIAQAVYGGAHVAVPELPDFSMPVRPEWVQMIERRAEIWCSGKPVMVLRPPTIRTEWDGSKRNPDLETFAALYRAIRDKFHVVSIADLAPGKERLVGPELEVDVVYHAGELTHWEMTGLFKRAQLVFGGAGFGPVLAQAVGTPTAVVYGGRESYRTTERAGAHLAPTLGIDPDQPCDCHSEAPRCARRCSKHISLEPATARLLEFADRALSGQAQIVATTEPARRPRVLVFGTVWEDCPDRARLTDLWVALHGKLNPGCDLMLVDSASPYRPRIAERHPDVRVHDFGDNVGHLSRGGRDGWGRAFCRGLQAAVDDGYDYVVHVEGDSLCRLPLQTVCEQMQRDNTKVMTTIVRGMKRDHDNWVETGLMFFSTEYLRSSGFVRQYNWTQRKVSPTPEVIIFNIVRGDTKFAEWRVLRGDKNDIRHDNVTSLDLDWMTHCHNDVWAYDRYAEALGVDLGTPRTPPQAGVQPSAAAAQPCTSEKPVAVVLGGAECWRRDLDRALALLGDRAVEYYAVNDQIASFELDAVGVTLHPDKLGVWKQQRKEAGLPPLREYWAHRAHPLVTNNTNAREWRGSSGLFAVQIARLFRKRNRVILCGVPMQQEQNHFVRHRRWDAALAFRLGWTSTKSEIAGEVRSMSGWTAELIGEPTEDWLTCCTD